MSQKLLSIFAILILLCSGIVYGDVSDEIPEIVYYRYGMKKLMERDYTLAIAGFSKAIELNENFAKAYVGRGIAYYKQVDRWGGIKGFNKMYPFSVRDLNVILHNLENDKFDNATYKLKDFDFLREFFLGFKKSMLDMDKAIYLQQPDALYFLREFSKINPLYIKMSKAYFG